MMKKGFTLVELLAVVALLAIVAIIAVPSAFNFSKSIKEDLYCKKVVMILNSAESWGNEHLGSLKTSCYTERTIRQLIDDGFLKKESNTPGKYMVNPYNDTAMDNMVVRIYKKDNNAIAWYFETDDELVNACAVDVGWSRDDGRPWYFPMGSC